MSTLAASSALAVSSALAWEPQKLSPPPTSGFSQMEENTERTQDDEE